MSAKEEKAHALLSPSSASRWLACTPSARLEEGADDTSGKAAREGTLAHDLCDLYLRNYLKLVKRAVYNKELKIIKNNELYNLEMDGHAVDYVADMVALIEDNDIKEVFIEKRLDLTEFVPEGFGRGDFGGVSEHTIYIRDLKYGRGDVSAEGNPQIKLYALGTLMEFDMTHDIQEINMGIYQPRTHNYSTVVMTRDELMDWAVNLVKPNAQLAFDGEGERVAGDHCKYCKVKHLCRTLQEHAMGADVFDLEDPNKLTDEDVAVILERAPVLREWLESVVEYAYEEATVNGKEWEGMKLVNGRGNRFYSDPDKVIAELKKKKVKRVDFMTDPKLLGITKLTQNIGAENVTKWIGDLLSKSSGKPQLVPKWDKRKEAKKQSAEEAFKNVDLNDVKT